MTFKNEHNLFTTAPMSDDANWSASCVLQPKPPISFICIGNNPRIQIGVDKKFNRFQKKMIKWCFGFEVKENNNE